MNFISSDEWSDQAINKAGMDVRYVRIHVTYDVSLQLMNRFPKILSFAFLVPDFGKYVGGEVYVRPVVSSHFQRLVLRTGVNDREFVDKRIPLHQFGTEDENLFSDGFLLIQGRDAKGDLHSLFFLFFN